MSEKIWTEQQKNAIYPDNETVLISAAAGSGKTAVLVEHVIKKITVAKHPCNIDELLIVTFTNIAAIEMKNRISKRINQLINENPSDKNLQKQRLLLQNAFIGTIDSFCNKLVRENFYKLNISPNFKIVDGYQLSLIKDAAMEATLNKFYESKNKNFLELVELFSGDKDDSNLIEIIERIYNFCRTEPFPNEWLENIKNIYNYSGKLSDTIWGQVLIDYSLQIINCCIDLLKNSISISESDENIKKAYFEALNSNLGNFINLKNCIGGGSTWNDVMYQIQNFTLAKFKSLRGYDGDINKKIINNSKEYVNKSLKKLKSIFIFEESQSLKHINRLYDIVSILAEVVNEYFNQLVSIKIEKNLADFNDVEHWALGLLIDKKNDKYKQSDFGKEISHKFSEIMIDEFQDVNEIQNMIFKMLSKNGKNIFMVGDIKQSIYKFRNSKPEIFLRNKSNFSLYDSATKKYPAKILLNKNFRSRKDIINSVNFVFKNLMSEEVGEIEYSEEEFLYYGADYSKHQDNKVDIDILYPNRNANIELNKKNDSEEVNLDIIEAHNIAKIILKMIGQNYKIQDENGIRNATYRDFCILLRSVSNHANVYHDELTKLGIPCWTDEEKDFFNTTEINVILSILKVVNNPVNDIAIVAALLSSIFDFKMDDLLAIKSKNIDMPIYFVVKKNAELGDNKCRRFIEKIEKYRKLSSIMSVSKLINYIYDDTGYNVAVQTMENGQNRLSNLRILSQYAKKHEGFMFKGISDFLKFIDKIKKKKINIATPKSYADSSNVVRIMSIHKSKGLEFPICILAGCSKQFNIDKNNLLLHSQLGIGLKLKNKNHTVLYDNIVRKAISLKTRQEEISEELRIFYVAMTRAKEKLIIIVPLENMESTIEKTFSIVHYLKNIPPYMVQSVTSYNQWILFCLLRHDVGDVLIKEIYPNLKTQNMIKDENPFWTVNLIGYDTIINADNAKKLEVLEPLDVSTSNLNVYDDIFKKRFNYGYKYKNIQKIPLKITASSLSTDNYVQNYIATATPKILSKNFVSAVDKGNALHEFLYFFDFKNISNFDTEYNRIRSENLITAEKFASLDIKSIKNFLNGPIGHRISKSRKILKEYRFTVRCPVRYINNEYEDSNEFTIVQGALDCAFLEDNHFVIIDYKTDKIKNIDDLFDKYINQLKMYKYALEKYEKIFVRYLIIYSFYLSDYKILEFKV